MTARRATCSCGQLAVECEGKPDLIVACNCTWCQRRTGSPFGLGAYFPEAQVRANGDYSDFTRPGAMGRMVTNHFCPQCGTGLFWHLDRAPGLVGVAVGAFADPDFPPPVRVVWTQHQHAWVRWPEGIETHVAARPLPPAAS